RRDRGRPGDRRREHRHGRAATGDLEEPSSVELGHALLLVTWGPGSPGCADPRKPTRLTTTLRPVTLVPHCTRDNGSAQGEPGPSGPDPRGGRSACGGLPVDREPGPPGRCEDERTLPRGCARG